MKKYNLNLQLCVPYQKCLYNCPMCIASNNNKFKNLYNINKAKYFNKLNKILQNMNGDIIITGATEPTLNKNWIHEVINFIDKDTRPNIQKIELQTHNIQSFDESFVKDFDVIAYSLAMPSDIAKAIKIAEVRNSNENKATKPIIRWVILATVENFDYIKENYNGQYVDQITIKDLQHAKKDTEVNEYIDSHKISSEVFRQINFNTDSLRYDTNCLASKYRYRVFRENGKLYKKW